MRASYPNAQAASPPCFGVTGAFSLILWVAVSLAVTATDGAHAQPASSDQFGTGPYPPLAQTAIADADEDGLSDDVDALPNTPSNACAGSATFADEVIQNGALAQCAAPVKLSIAPTVDVRPGGRAEIYAPKTFITGGFSLPLGAELRVVATRARACEGVEFGDDGGPDGPSALGAIDLAIVPAFPDLSLPSPLAVSAAPGDDTHLYVATQGGVIYSFEARADITTGEADIFLDLSDRTRANGEQGLLGFEFHPDYASNGQVFSYYNANANPDIEIGDSVVAHYTANPSTRSADRTTEVELLRFTQPFQNHNGGDLAFGPDRMLYITSGDGGSSNDPNNNAQNVENLLGKILRIAPDGSIPADNPLVDTPGARGEIWAYGLRNPFRFSFDPVTQRLWTGDVGQGAQEEIDIIRGCGNYGWRVYEGTQSNINPDGLPFEDFQAPVHTYPRDMGRSVTGGVVYRGSEFPDLHGRYIYGDFVSGRIWALSATSEGDLIENIQIGSAPNPSSFGTGINSEPLITSFDGRIYHLVPSVSAPAP